MSRRVQMMIIKYHYNHYFKEREEKEEERDMF